MVTNATIRQWAVEDFQSLLGWLFSISATTTVHFWVKRSSIGGHDNTSERQCANMTVITAISGLSLLLCIDLHVPLFIRVPVSANSLGLLWVYAVRVLANRDPNGWVFSGVLAVSLMLSALVCSWTTSESESAISLLLALYFVVWIILTVLQYHFRTQASPKELPRWTGEQKRTRRTDSPQRPRSWRRRQSPRMASRNHLAEIPWNGTENIHGADSVRLGRGRRWLTQSTSPTPITFDRLKRSALRLPECGSEWLSFHPVDPSRHCDILTKP